MRWLISHTAALTIGAALAATGVALATPTDHKIAPTSAYLQTEITALGLRVASDETKQRNDEYSLAAVQSKTTNVCRYGKLVYGLSQLYGSTSVSPEYVFC